MNNVKKQFAYANCFFHFVSIYLFNQARCGYTAMSCSLPSTAVTPIV